MLWTEHVEHHYGREPEIKFENTIFEIFQSQGKGDAICQIEEAVVSEQGHSLCPIEKVPRFSFLHTNKFHVLFTN